MPIRQESSSRPGRLLVVDDDRRRASATAQWLCQAGWHAVAAGSEAEGLRIAGRGGLAACLIAAALPAAGAAAVAAAARAAADGVGIVAVMPGDADLGPPSWADAALPLPASDAALLEAVEAAIAASGRRGASPRGCPLLGDHPAMTQILDVVDRVAATSATVLVTGESGTGKSLLAREIHRRSGRPGRFVEVACGSLSESLLESELFGHVAGSFTGAAGNREGKFLRADGGTIFLDEIATASPALQVKLLRVLQDMQFEPVGGCDTQRVDARVILATNEDLESLVAAGRFRADLFWRINVVAVEMPPLRARPTDIPLLADHFLKLAAARAGRVVEGFAPAAFEALLAHAWPGNVRELEHAIERGAFLGRGPRLEAADLPAAVLGGGLAAGRPTAAAPLRQALATPERQLIVAALEQAGWRRDVAARSLGINRTTLYKKLKRLGMDLAALEPAR
jgi:two-component system response regulator AtoC